MPKILKAGKRRIAMGSTGGGSSSTTTVDPEYNARMATIAEQQQEMFNQMYSFYQYGTFDGPPQNIEGISQKSKDAVTLEGIAKEPGYNPYQGQQNEFGIDYSNADYSFLDDLGYKPPTYYANPANPNQTTTDRAEAEQWVKDYNAEHGTEVWVTQDGKEFSSYDDAVEYSYQQGFAERPASYASMEQAQIESNMQLIPQQTELQMAQLEAELGLTPQRAGLESAQIEAQSGLLPFQTEAAKTGYQYDTKTAETGIMREGERQRVLGYGSQVIPKFFESAMAGVDVNRNVEEARATAAHELNKQQDQFNRTMRGLGTSPDSPRYAALQDTMGLGRAQTIAGTMENARRSAENESYNRLQGAMGILGGV
jgi:hypothetical protein